MSRATLSRIERGYQVSPPKLYSVLTALEIDINEYHIAIPERKKNDIDSVRSQSKRKKVFISYSHQDKKYLERLLVHLKPLEKKELIDAWVDTQLMAGDRWKKEIEKALTSAKAAVLLVSADFLASDFIVDNELPPLLQKANSEGATIIPVILKPCRFTRDVNLNEFQAINSPDEPVGLLDEVEREMVFDAVSQRIEELFK
ncbi:MAG: toll/interleukin-1 receptor domain-containing protein [Neptuniibacter sp.]|nr:toll/interleukin-1 receptor domain-containing protein [Neptuniibacter sp.]